MQPSIFISIASYRDPDCQNTVRDLFEKAAHPERLAIGICWQFVPGEDDDCFKITTRPDQVRSIEVHASQSKGACWARSQVQTLYQGEDYVLQIDSHMRFVQDWDEVLIKMLAQCPSEKAILSTYPLSFTPPNELGKEGYVTIFPKAFDAFGVIGQRSEIADLQHAPQVPKQNAFIGAGLVFGKGSWITEVPYDSHLYFEGEEITLAARLWTSGWDIYVPNAAVAYHDYGVRPERPRHWKDQTDWGTLNIRSRNRIRHMLEIDSRGDQADLVDIERFGLGSVRSLADYEAFSGLDFRARLYRGKPLVKADEAADQPEQVKNRCTVFTNIWRNNSWGAQETRSGGGSTMAATVRLREWLPRTFDFLGIRVLADAGCGEMNWAKEITPSLRLYLGYEIVPELVAELRSKLKERANCFVTEADIVTAALPEADAILCRDVLTHLPLDAVLMALKRFRQSGAKYLIATTNATGRNTWVKAGGWQALDLTAAPFNLPAPRLAFEEGGGKRLGVWAIADLPE